MCGIASAICPDLTAPRIVHKMLRVLQNRGNQEAGIAISGGCQTNDLIVCKGPGRPDDVFNPNAQQLLRGRASIGHARYATSGNKGSEGAHPFKFGDVAVCHNGNVVNTKELKKKLAKNTELTIGSDTEIIAALIAQAKGSLHKRITSVCSQLKGSYVLSVLQAGGTIAVARDPQGIRPAHVGQIKLGGKKFCHLVASETCAIEMVGGKVVGEIEPGTVQYFFPDNTTKVRRFAAKRKHAHCIFELIYFTRPMAEFNQVSSYTFDQALGRALARQMKLNADPNAIVIPVLKSGLCGALGLAQESGIKYDPILIDTGLSNRTFMERFQFERVNGNQLKHFPVRTPAGLRYIIVDDSIVRGTAGKSIIEVLRRNNPKSIELAIPCPMFVKRCRWGIDTATDKELIAYRHKGNITAIRKELGADALHYLTLENLKGVVAEFGWDPDEFCYECFGGKSPII